MAEAARLLADSPWPGLIAWTVLYISDYALTIACARMYASGVKDKIAFEGSYELTPYFEKDVDSLRAFSPRFVLAPLWTAALLVLLWHVTREAGSWRVMYSFALGALVLVQLAVHVRHVRNFVLFRGALEENRIRGRIQYSRAMALRISAAELLAFALMFLMTALATGSWFVLGGVVGCVSLAWKHNRLERKHETDGAPRPHVRGFMDFTKLKDFATRYTSAWNSQDPASVAAFYAAKGSLTVNEGEPAVGREAITKVARGFMTAFPDMVVAMDDLVQEPRGTAYHWTLTGTNTGPGGTGKRVRIGGYELWHMSPDGLIAESKGHFDAAEYERQLEHGVD